jgi:steroid 5-alpha reductase family enzyme
MFDAALYLRGLVVLLLAALAVWLISIVKRDVSIVDSLWGGFFVLAALAYAWPLAAFDARGLLVLALVVVWALRLTIYVTWRNWGEDEDSRYREIRGRNEPHFALKSVYLVFGLQAVLASVISLPLLAALRSGAPLGVLDALGAALAVFGLAFETAADWQLARFKADAGNRGRVLARGLWRYSRHPNYFGECCFWWGIACLGVAAGGWWSLVSALLMTWLLLRVSGVALLERSIGERRPDYIDYVRSTSAFIPWPRRNRAVSRAHADVAK